MGVETLLNYKYGDFTKKNVEWFKHRESKTVLKVNGEITDPVVNQIYDEALEVMECHYSSLQKNNKSEIFVDLQILNENSNSLEFEVINVISVFNPSMLWQQKSFGQGDDWHAVQGSCTDGSNPSNAADQVGRYTQWNLAAIQSLSIGEWFSDFQEIPYHTEDEETWFSLNSNDPMPGDDVIDYFEWKKYGYDGGYYVFCIEYDEMNYYLGNAETEAQKYESILNKELMHFEMFSDLIPGENTPLLWTGYGEYAKRNIDLSRVIYQLSPCQP